MKDIWKAIDTYIGKKLSEEHKKHIAEASNKEEYKKLRRIIRMSFRTPTKDTKIELLLQKELSKNRVKNETEKKRQGHGYFGERKG